MSEQEAPWRSYLYEGTHTEWQIFAVPLPTPPGVPGRTLRVSIPDERNPISVNRIAACDCRQKECEHIQQAREAARYWLIRSKWANLGPDDFQAFYDKWAPRRDRALSLGDVPELYLGKTYAEWQLFYTALADERAFRQHMYAKLDGLHGREILSIWYDKPKEGPMDEARAQQAQLGGRSG